MVVYNLKLDGKFLFEMWEIHVKSYDEMIRYASAWQYKMTFVCSMIFRLNCDQKTHHAVGIWSCVTSNYKSELSSKLLFSGNVVV